MASPSISNALRLRKTLTLFRRIQQSSASTIAASHCLIRQCVRVWRPQPSLLNTGVRVSGAAFSTGRYGGGESEEIGPDTILFEGCDYKHWLITIDFPKDANLTPQDMVRTYEETCAKGLGISIEEAKKKIYACSTTTYQGFQAIMTEEESEKFKGIPGVVFILPDSYIDPVNKEYGGDKYENGVITHRPPPVQYRREGGRFRDRNRNPDQQRFDRQGGPPNQAQNYGPPGSQQNYGPPGSQQNFGSAQNYPPQQNYGSPGSPQAYPPQQGFGQAGQSGAQRTYAPQQSFSMPEAPQGQQNYGSRGASQSYPPQGQQNYGSRGASQSYPPQGQQNYGSRGASQSYPPSHGAPQGYPTQGNYGPPGERGAYQAQTRGSGPPPHLNYDQYNQGTTQGTHAPAGQGYSGANNRNYSPDNDGHFGQ